MSTSAYIIFKLMLPFVVARDLTLLACVSSEFRKNINFEKCIKPTYTQIIQDAIDHVGKRGLLRSYEVSDGYNRLLFKRIGTLTTLSFYDCSESSSRTLPVGRRKTGIYNELFQSNELHFKKNIYASLGNDIYGATGPTTPSTILDDFITGAALTYRIIDGIVHID